MNNTNKMKPNFIDIKGSSNIAAVAYTKSTKEFRIKFIAGNTYKYEPVSLKVYNDFMEAESKGAFFAANIKNNSEITCTKL